MNTTPHSTTSCGISEHVKTALAVIFLLIVIAAWVVTLILEKQPKGYDVEIPMANAHIEWEGAGYNGVYGDV